MMDAAVDAHVARLQRSQTVAIEREAAGANRLDGTGARLQQPALRPGDQHNLLRSPELRSVLDLALEWLLENWNSRLVHPLRGQGNCTSCSRALIRPRTSANGGRPQRAENFGSTKQNPVSP